MGDLTLEAAVWSNGVDYLNAERTRVTVDDPRFVEAFQFVADLRLRHKVSPDQEQRAALNTFERWKVGQLGTHVMGPWDQPSFWQLPFRWDIAPFPTSPRTKRPASWTGSVGFGVSAKTKHPREAVDLTRFFATDEDGQRTNYQLGQAVPNLISMAKGEFLKFEKPPASKQVFLDNLETWGRPTLGWYTSNDDWLALFNTEAGAVYRGEITADAWGRQHAPALTTELTKQAQLPSVLP
ncbi:MAG TPA: extracellular solute-binding protein [Chloroflexota bacterium]|nr:extracellular solute-binding protein [Chloroflexota bacterium]